MYSFGGDSHTLIDLPFWGTNSDIDLIIFLQFHEIYTVIIEGRIWPISVNEIILQMNLSYLDQLIFPCKSILLSLNHF